LAGSHRVGGRTIGDNSRLWRSLVRHDRRPVRIAGLIWGRRRVTWQNPGSYALALFSQYGHKDKSSDKTEVLEKFIARFKSHLT
jgi:hypothetical protein